MKKILLLFTILLLNINVCFAHWMPESETFVGGVGPGCTLGYVKSIYGEPQQKKWFNGDGIRGVAYIYGPLFSITGRTWNNDPRPENDLIVVGYSLKANNLSTPSGITVGIPYSTVSGMYGYEPLTTSYNGGV